MKECRSCGAIHENPEEGFYRAGIKGFRSPCKGCILKRCKRYVSKNRDAQLERLRNHYQANKDAYREKTARWAKENPERLKELRKKYSSTEKHKERRRADAAKLREDPKNRLVNSVRTGISRSIYGVPGKIRHLPYTTDQLKEHLEKQFAKGMTWDNYGEWHVDHILPVSSFKFSGDPKDPEFLACWAMSNLRPMWAPENISKHNKRTHLI